MKRLTNISLTALALLLLGGCAKKFSPILTGDASVNVTVKMLVSKIVVEKITNGLSGSSLSGRTITINSM